MFIVIIVESLYFNQNKVCAFCVNEFVNERHFHQANNQAKPICSMKKRAESSRSVVDRSRGSFLMKAYTIVGGYTGWI